MAASQLRLPRLYPILDHEVLARHGLPLADAARDLADAGCTLLQYRNKVDPAGPLLEQAQHLRQQFPSHSCRLLLNDRADLARLAHFDGVHVGQTDLAPIDARRVLGPGQILGVSTHSLDQFLAALLQPVDYIAVGPIFTTTTKHNPDPVVGLDLLRIVRSLTHQPIVAIGGITLHNAADVIQAGADSVALISALFVPGQRLSTTAAHLLRTLGEPCSKQSSSAPSTVQ